MKFNKKVAVVTGASTGIGRNISQVIAANGGRVALVARSIERLKETQKLIIDSGGEAKIFPTDLRDEAAINKLSINVQDSFGDIDFLLNVAGVWHNDKIAYAGVPLVDTPAEQINEVLDVGIRAPMLITRLFLPGMIRKRQGKILCISGTFASGGAGWLHYYVSKLAIEHFTVGLSQELREHEIQVNCISPSDTDTEALRKFFPEDAETALNPVEIAKLASFLLSNESDHITGQIIVIKDKAVH